MVSNSIGSFPPRVACIAPQTMSRSCATTCAIFTYFGLRAYFSNAALLPTGSGRRHEPVGVALALLGQGSFRWRNQAAYGCNLSSTDRLAPSSQTLFAF